MESFVRAAGGKAGKWRRVPVNVSVCLLTSHPKPKVIFTFAPLGMVLKLYEDTKRYHVISHLKQFLIDVPILYFGFLCS